jgi:hypothetical protein
MIPGATEAGTVRTELQGNTISQHAYCPAVQYLLDTSKFSDCKVSSSFEKETIPVFT